MNIPKPLKCAYFNVGDIATVKKLFCFLFADFLFCFKEFYLIGDAQFIF